MSAQALRARPRPSAVGTSASESWALMEARLVTARVDDLLGEAASRLSRLLGEVELPEEVETAVTDTLASVEAGRRTIGAARRGLRMQ
jgi:hypothetical protein